MLFRLGQVIELGTDRAIVARHPELAGVTAYAAAVGTDGAVASRGLAWPACPNSVILRQVTKGLAVRMAVLFLVNQATAETSA